MYPLAWLSSFQNLGQQPPWRSLGHISRHSCCDLILNLVVPLHLTILSFHSLVFLWSPPIPFWPPFPTLLRLPVPPSSYLPDKASLWFCRKFVEHYLLSHWGCVTLSPNTCQPQPRRLLLLQDLGSLRGLPGEHGGPLLPVAPALRAGGAQ